jgi:DNA invertase Pin-like site-specific DNA recombinase
MNDKNVDIVSKIEGGIFYKNNKLAFLRGIEVAEKESQHNSVRQTISIKNRRSRGEHIGPVKYGYKLDNTKKLVNNLKEQQMIKGILLSRESDTKLARDLNDSSYPKKRGKKWTACMISRIRKMYSYYDLQN